MARTWTTVRVFISSTFRDMHAERDHLIKVTFPKLRARLEKYRIHLVDIDLRWGVTQEQAENDRVLDLCLDQIDECRPFFIGILGERYGWVPGELPELDESQYGWIQAATGKSITDLEIMHGVLHNPGMAGHASFYTRAPSFMDALAEPHVRVFAEVPDEEEIAEFGPEEARTRAADRKRKLADLKREIKAYCESTDSPLHEYPCEWEAARPSPEDESTGRLVGLERFGEWIEEDLWNAVAKEYPHVLEPEPERAREGTVAWLDEEQDYHERFIESRLQVYVGRQGIHNALTEYLDGDSTQPLLLVGGSGTGKSAIMGKLWQDWQKNHPDEFILPHFVGASPGSTDLRVMLRRFCVALREQFQLAQVVEVDLPDGGKGQETRPYEIPDDPVKLPQAFREMLQKVPQGRRAVILIDAVNQLDESGNAHQMHWLPGEVLPHVKIVVSCIEEPGREQVALDAVRRRNIPELRVEQLTHEERFEIVTQIPSLSARTLDPQQIGMLLDNPATQNPLYLIVALEELRGFGSFERLNEKIGSFPRIEGEEGLNALFGQVIERQEQEIGRETVRQVFSLIACSRMGLSEQELTELLQDSQDGDAEQERAGQMQIMLRQLRPYLLRRGELVDYYHRNLFKAVRNRYLRGHEPIRRGEDFVSPQEQPWHQTLATYFQSKGVESLRMLTETRHHMQIGGTWEELEALLTDLPFLEAKVVVDLTFDLPEDFRGAVEALPVDRPMRRILELLDEAIRRDIHFIARHGKDYPQALFQSVWNHGWWYDSEDAAQHYEEPEGGWKKPPPWERTGPKLHELLEKWRAEKQTRAHVVPWLRSRRPPVTPLASPLKAILRGHESSVTSVAHSADGQRIASGSLDKTVRLWEAESGAEIAVLRGHEEGVNSVACSPDGQRIVSESGSERIVWDSLTGERLPDADAEAVGVGGGPGGPYVAQRQQLETVVTDHDNRPVALFPEPLRHIVTHPDGGTWAGNVGHHVHILTLKGGE